MKKIDITTIEGRSKALKNVKAGAKFILSENEPVKNHDVVCIWDFGIYDSSYYIIDLITNEPIESRKLPTNRHEPMNLTDQFYFVVEKAMKHGATRIIPSDPYNGAMGMAHNEFLNEKIQSFKREGYFPGHAIHVPELRPIGMLF
jgi:hypothetical protein